MKKMFCFLVSISFAMISCNKCYECDFSTPTKSDVREICRNNFQGDKVTFQKTIDEYKLAGYRCVEKK
jgi:hypothetical protein